MSRPADREYALLAPVYDRLWRRYLSASIDSAVARLPLAGATNLLDVGCGTGLLLAKARSRQPELELHGIDLTRQMLARARRRLGSAADLRRGSADALPYADDHADIVVSTSMLHCVSGPHAPVIREWRRVLRPGGTLVITDWNPEHVGTRTNTLLLRALGQRNALHPPSGVRALLTEAGFAVTSLDVHRAATWGLWTVAGVAHE
jgi:ubiquinone/menaquinone biosynthesis C-methylase UbiE